MLIRNASAGRGGDTVTPAEVLALAAPPCHECGAPVERLETLWHRGEDREWRPGPWFMVCPTGHRVLVEPLD